MTLDDVFYSQMANELRMYADDLHSRHGHNTYSVAMSKAADEILKLYKGVFASYDKGFAEGTQAEREEIAKICEDGVNWLFYPKLTDLAAMIRARSDA